MGQCHHHNALAEESALIITMSSIDDDAIMVWHIQQSCQYPCDLNIAADDVHNASVPPRSSIALHGRHRQIADTS